MRAADVPLVPAPKRRPTVDAGARGGGGGRLPGAAQGRRPAAAARACGSSHGPDELEAAYGMAAAEAEAAFGDGSLYLEKAVAPARHVEIQVLGDSHGGVLTLGERECSIQRRHQKLIEESPSPALDAETREAMESAAERACQSIGYRNAGTFEFLLGAGPQLLLHRAERAPAGRASGHRARHRHRPRPRAAARRGRRDACAHRPRGAAGPRDRGAHQRRGPGARLRAGARARHPRCGRRSGRASGSTRTSRTATRPAVLRLAARQADRLGRDRPQAIDRDAARARRARDRGRADDARAGDRHPAQRGVRERPLLDGFLDEAAERLPAIVGS